MLSIKGACAQPEVVMKSKKKKSSQKDTVFNIFFAASCFLSVCVYALLSKLQGDPTLKMMTSVLVIILLVTLNTAVGILHEQVKEYKEKANVADPAAHPTPKI